MDEPSAYHFLMKKYLMPEEKLMESGFPRVCNEEEGRAIVSKTAYRCWSKSSSFTSRVCDRCRKNYTVNDLGIGISGDPCNYHLGYPKKIAGTGDQTRKFACCLGGPKSEGCHSWPCHVSRVFSMDNLYGFVQTLEKSSGAHSKIYGLDCEMCYTTHGFELSRISVVNFDGETVYDTLVKPKNAVLDYMTRYSGIDEHAMKGVTMSLSQVQADLLDMFDKRTILVGHSLENDFRALKLIHDTVVDTSAVFPHKLPPCKRALRDLTWEYLHKRIQNSDNGHDSIEDALACIDLVKWKLMKDPEYKQGPSQQYD